MKIKINPLAKGISDNEKKYILLLEFCQGFDEGVNEIRKKLGIPYNQRNLDGVISYKPEQLPNFAELRKEAYALVSKLNLPITLSYSVENIIQWDEVMGNTQPISVFDIGTQLNRKALFNAELRPPPSKQYAKHLGEEKSKLLYKGEWDNWYRSNREKLSQGYIDPAYPLIQINKRLKKQELIDAIEKNWIAIEQSMEYFEKSVPYNMAVNFISLEELEISSIIYEYRQIKPPLKHQEIYKKLHSENNITYTDVGNEVKRKYFKIRQLLITLGFVKQKK